MNSKLKNFFLTLFAGASIGTGVYVSSNNATPQQQSSTAPSINVSSSGVPLTQQFGTNDVDIYYIGNPSKAQERNVLDPTFLNQNKALSFPRNMYASVGSISQYLGAPVLSTAPKGYTMYPSYFASDYDYRNYGGGVAIASWQSYFCNTEQTFKNALGIPCDVCVNAIIGTWKDDDKLISILSPDYIEIGAESVTTNITDDQYIANATPIIDSILKKYHTKKIILDCALVYRGNKKSTNWNTKLYSTYSAKYPTVTFYGRFYIQTADRENYTNNQDSNVVKICNFFDNGLPNDISTFKNIFPTWKIAAGEVLIEDNRSDGVFFINNTMSGIFCWGRMYQALIQNQYIMPVAYQMARKNLVNQDVTTNVNYAIIKLLNNTLYKANATVTTLTLTGMDGVTGISLSNGKKQTILLNNSTTISYTISNASVDNKLQKANYTQQREYAKTWRDPIVTDSIVTNNINILPCSVTVLTFTSK